MQSQFREMAVEEALKSLAGGRTSLYSNATQHPMFEWMVSKIEFTLNLQAAIQEWEGVEAPPVSSAPPALSDDDSGESPRRASLRRLQSDEKCRKPSRGLTSKRSKCRKLKNKAYFGQLLKRHKSVLSPEKCCKLCSKTSRCVAWTVKPRSAGKEKGCFLRKSGKIKERKIRGYWSGYLTDKKAPTSYPSPPPPYEEVVYNPPDESYQSSDGEAVYNPPDEFQLPPDQTYDPPTYDDDFWDQFLDPPPVEPENPSLPRGTGKYKELLDLNWKFFEAQRSGPEPYWNRIGWRGTSHTSDRVVGGLYDAGDFLKLNFPLASTMIHTGHGFVEFMDGCSSSKTEALRMYKWGIKYLLDCLDAEKGEYVAQIGDPKIDHNYWGRAEEQRTRRPALIYKRDSMPAPDLYGSVAAALAQASVVFEREGDNLFARDCLDGAMELYKWGDGRPGKYSNFYKDQTKVYRSSDGDDSMTAAAGWIYRATGDSIWLEKARKYWDYSKANVYAGWDSLWAAHAIHMITLADRGVSIPGIDEYRRWVDKKYWRAWLEADGYQSIVKTPKGLHYPKWNAWANLAFSTTVSSHALLQAKFTDDRMLRSKLMKFAQKQAEYAIGGNGERSYVIGWGANWPKFAHHAGASCPNLPAPCGKAQFSSKDPNPNGPNGAMVAGPAGVRRSRSDPDGAYNDKRDDYVTNEVALDYNAGLSTLYCGMIELF
jgi:endoglucanase